jgi:hypothetical protein
MVSNAVVRVAILLELFFVALTVVISAVGVRLGVGPDGGRRAGLQFESRVLLLLLVGLLILLVHMRGTGVDLEAAGAALGRKSRCAFCCSCLLSC